MTRFIRVLLTAVLRVDFWGRRVGGGRLVRRFLSLLK